MELLLVAFGGGIGAVARFLVIQLTNIWKISNYFATIFVNLTGSFFIGVALHQLFHHNTLLLFLTVGMLGGFTTFSTFSFEALKLLQNKKYRKFTSYIVINMLGGLILFIVGFTSVA